MLIVCEPGPPYLHTHVHIIHKGEREAEVSGGEVGSLSLACTKTEEKNGEKMDSYTWKRTGYLVLPESSILGGRISIAFNSVQIKEEGELRIGSSA